jgi:hypothetical protein
MNPNSKQTQRGMAMVGAYFAAYVGIGFVFPFFSGGDTLLSRTQQLLGLKDGTSKESHDCQQYYEDDKK